MPSAGNNYVIGSGFVVNTPPVGNATTLNYTFGGDSLTVQSGGTLQLRSSNASTTSHGNYTISGLTLQSGSSLTLSTGVGSIIYTLQTGLNLASSGSVTLVNNNNAAGYVVGLVLAPNSVLSGGANINLIFQANGQNGVLEKYMTVSSANNPYTGNWNVTAANSNANREAGLVANAVNALGTGSVSLTGSTLVNQVADGLDSISGVNVGANSFVEVNATWNNPAATLALNAASSKVTISGANTAMNIGNLTGVTGSSITGNASGESFSVNTTTDSLYAGTIAGSIAFTQSGPATLTLTGNNTYTGGTTVTGGLINFSSLSNFGTGSITLNGGGLQWATGNTADVSAQLNPLGANGATFDTNGNDVTLAGALSGAGGVLIKQGAGTLTLTGANTYDGGTQINAGTVQIGAGGTSGSIEGNVADNGMLAFNLSNAATFNGSISGTGGVSQLGSGTTILTADNTYTGETTISAGTLQLGNGGNSGSVAGNVVDNGTLSINRSDTVTLPGVISGTGNLAQIGTGSTTLTSDNTYTGGTSIKAGTLQLGNGNTAGSVLGDIADNAILAFNRSDTVVYSNIISGSGGLNQMGPGTLQLDGAQTYTGPTNVLSGVLAVDGSIQSDTTTVASGATLSGFGDLHGNVINQGTVWPGNAIVGDTNYGTLTIHGSYVGQGGLLELNTYLGGDGSPSDVLAIDGGAVTGNTGVIVHNTAKGSGETSGDGILVVSAINGATTTAGAFNLVSETRSGALDYRLFRGSVDGTSPDSWYLRNEFTVPPEPPEPPVPPEPPQPPDPILPPDPPPEPLPPGVYPIIGPDVATYGVVQPVARELGIVTLGTMDQRIGDSAWLASSTGDTDHGPSAWGRLFATNIDNSYRAFAAPQANGNLYGFQTGVDVWQGQLFPESIDRFGGYVSYGEADINVRGLVTNAEATNYAMQHTGTLTLRATSAGAYWTHYGISGWYLDGVVQASTYNGAATTQDARLNTNGVGFVGSLEFGYPIALPQLGASFALEPQVQAIWQHTSFSPNNDGVGDVALGSTHGSTGRIGVRGKWQLTNSNGQLWEPYAAVNFWRDWGGRSTTVFGDSSSSASTAPLLPQANRAELAGGVTGKLLARLSVYSSLGYEHELGTSTNARREGFNADAGLRYTW
ncbi:autotransporter outer membrane beta-barrel domain-containing protein [Dyella dinghuensis]|uniref:autotransporter outer membrane beta-barrel domain-containing protein n=1 Tax=Dyella dinghuensis TaxID=1920169 RepID=UPI0013155FD7|nr:autotransporter outer membrane beta-barrel domain-containing protein [Dyella dinghuensis]